MVSIHDTSIPKSQPIRSFKDLLAWQPGRDEYNVAHTPLHPRPAPLSRHRKNKGTLDGSVPEISPELSQPTLRDCKVIVCHDMAGGYIEDASPQGNDYSSIYSIQYWNHIDTFIYFSHYRITLPPPVWTNAAHRNGVRCLGTIITEWLPGVLETDEMVSGPGQSFADEDGNDTVDRRWFSKTYADKLVDLAVYYQFDGWFINIESILRGGAQQANQVIAFLAYLRQQIHARILGGELIWYDSVISSTGEVAWQDKLSLENYRFFEQSDGIFTNYTWKEHSVGESAALAGHRNRDVYTGIDVWGRNTFGGGGYTTYKALEIIQREETSCALFAPAWTYQSLGKEGFMTHDRLFWTGYTGAGIHSESLPLSSFYQAVCLLLAGDLGRKPDGGSKEVDAIKDDNRAFLPVSAYIPARPSGCSSWFYTNFDRGFGKGFWVNGKLVSDKPWSHLSNQSLSPSMTKEIYVLSQDGSIRAPLPGRSVIRWTLSSEEAYNGGTSLVIQEFTLSTSTPSLSKAPSLATHPVDQLSDLIKDLSFPEDMLSSSSSQSRSRTLLIPLFDTQISLLDAQNSTVELIFKPCQDHVQVGVHLGMLATDADKEKEMDKDKHKSNTRFARKLSELELSQLLRPEAMARMLPTLRCGKEAPLSRKLLVGGLLGAITLDNDESDLGTAFAIPSPQDNNHGHLDAIERLEGGWQRLTLHLSSLFDLYNESPSDGEKRVDASSIVLSQLGVTVSYDGQTLTEPSSSQDSQSETSWPLMIVGSLAVVPTWSAHYKGSFVQGLTAEECQFIPLKRPIQQQHRHRHQQQDAIMLTGPQDNDKSTCIAVSATLSWNIGFPIVGPGLASPDASAVASGRVSTSEYSYYCIYFSLEKRDSKTIALANAKDSDMDSLGVKLTFIGMAFATRYRVSNLEIAQGGVCVSSGAELEGPFTPSAYMSTLPTAGPVSKQSEQELWAWVQGIRRDGRADDMQDWARTRLL